MSASIDTVNELEGIVGKTPPAMNLKVIDHLDEGALRWIAASPIMFATFGKNGDVGVSLAGGRPGFANGDAHALRLPVAQIDQAHLAQPGMGFGSLFLLPGVGETMRVNGHVSDVDDGEIRIAVDECYGHCGKALIRSEFWSAPLQVQAPKDAASLVRLSRFMALATIDAQGRADLSPKGDPAGAMAHVEDGRLWFADRPGNRRTDSFRNIISQPRVAALLIVPGSTHVACLSGTARITTDPAMRATFVVQDKVPAVVTVIDDLTLTLTESPTLVRADLWPLKEPTHGIQATKLLVDHIKLNKGNGLAGRLAGAAIALPGMANRLKKGLEKDYKVNLY